jgi:DNA-binding NarL/FixJ family response regulator
MRRYDSGAALDLERAPNVFAAAVPAEGRARKIALVDGSRLRRECLRLALAQHGPERPIVEAGSAAALLGLARDGAPLAAVIIGAATAERVDLAEIDTLRRELPETPLIVVAECENRQRARQILASGVRGFLPASLSLTVLMSAIDLVLAGGVYVPTALITGPAEDGSWLSAPAGPSAALTRRQRDVLALIAEGQSNKLIADALTMSESTVKAHVKQIIKRLNVANRTQAALIATGHGAFPPPPEGRAREPSAIGLRPEAISIAR